MGADHPIAWSHAFQGGRAWYTGGGHTDESYAEPLFRAHLLGGIRYAAGLTPPRIVSVTSTVSRRRLVGWSCATGAASRAPGRLRIERSPIQHADSGSAEPSGGRRARGCHAGVWQFSVVLTDPVTGLGATSDAARSGSGDQVLNTRS